MKQHEIVFVCFYCGKEVTYNKGCQHCDTPLSWDDIYIDYEDKYIEIYKVCVT